MISFMQKYGLWEYILFGSGLLVIGKLTYNFLNDTIVYNFGTGVAFLAGVLMISLPRVFVNIIKSRASKIGGSNKKI